jgi:hypothetical protein
MRVDACRRSSVIPAPSLASLSAKIKSFLEAMMEMYGYGRFVCDNDIAFLIHVRYIVKTGPGISLIEYINNTYAGKGETKHGSALLSEIHG